MSLSSEQILSKSLFPKDAMKFTCPNPAFRNLELLRQKFVFDQSDSGYLPIPLDVIQKMYSDVNIEFKKDWFYQNVIDPMQTGDYFPHSIDRDICEARKHPKFSY